MIEVPKTNGGKIEMGMSKLSIWVRDTAHPCLPYQSTAHGWVAAIVTCDIQPLRFGRVRDGLFQLPEPGPLGGGVHGQVEVPPGSYIVFAIATCKNILTDFAMVQVGCDDEACVNLLPKGASTCAGLTIWVLKVIEIMKKYYSPSSPAGREIPGEVISEAINALEKLCRYLPEDNILPRLPVSLDKLMKMAEEERAEEERAEKEDRATRT